jgi:hypothetical protein
LYESKQAFNLLQREISILTPQKREDGHIDTLAPCRHGVRYRRSLNAFGLRKHFAFGYWLSFEGWLTVWVHVIRLEGFNSQ